MPAALAVGGVTARRARELRCRHVGPQNFESARLAQYDEPHTEQPRKPAAELSVTRFRGRHSTASGMRDSTHASSSAYVSPGAPSTTDQ
jgi:hypothetical protein